MVTGKIKSSNIFKYKREDRRSILEENTLEYYTDNKKTKSFSLSVVEQISFLLMKEPDNPLYTSFLKFAQRNSLSEKQILWINKEFDKKARLTIKK